MVPTPRRSRPGPRSWRNRLCRRTTALSSTKAGKSPEKLLAPYNAVRSMAKVFISYRRHDETAAYAAIRSRTRSSSDSAGSVFLDVDNIPLGVDFRKHLGEAVGQCNVLLALMGEGWLGAGRMENRRCIRLGIMSGLKLNRRLSVRFRLCRCWWARHRCPRRRICPSRFANWCSVTPRRPCRAAFTAAY